MKGDHSIGDGIKILREDTGQDLLRTTTNLPTTPSLARLDSITLNVDNVDCVLSQNLQISKLLCFLMLHGYAPS